MRFFLHIGYDGSNFRGWQLQPKVRSVEETLKIELERIFKREMTVYGCGRTDAGVHASQYFAHINLDEAPDFDLKFRLNKNLHDDIAIFDVIEVEDDQHARYGATARTYDYFIHLYKDPVLKKYSSYYELKDLDIESMQKAAALLTQYKDFEAVCKRPHLNKHCLCEVSKAKLVVNEDQSRLRFSITSNRFLQGMVRICVYFLLEIGKGKLTVAEFEEMLACQKPVSGRRFSHPNGLFLSRVEYPFLKIEPRTGMGTLLQSGLEI